MEFLKSKEITLNPAGYLVSKTTSKPVSHEAFVKQQKAAEFTIKLAEAIKDKTFTTAKIDNLSDIKAEVLAAINAKNVKEFVTSPTKPTSLANEELVKFALDFVKYDEDKSTVDKINSVMAEFDVIDAVESVGDYFSEGLTKLNKIYTIEEILAAVKVTVEKLK